MTCIKNKELMLSDCNFEFAIIEICYDRIDTSRVYGTTTINKEVQEEVS